MSDKPAFIVARVLPLFLVYLAVPAGLFLFDRIVLLAYLSFLLVSNVLIKAMKLLIVEKPIQHRAFNRLREWEARLSSNQPRGFDLELGFYAWWLIPRIGYRAFWLIVFLPLGLLLGFLDSFSLVMGGIPLLSFCAATPHLVAFTSNMRWLPDIQWLGREEWIRQRISSRISKT